MSERAYLPVDDGEDDDEIPLRVWNRHDLDVEAEALRRQRRKRRSEDTNGNQSDVQRRRRATR